MGVVCDRSGSSPVSHVICCSGW